MFAMTTHGSSPFADAAFQPGDVFVFGSETRGLAPALREILPARPAHPPADAPDNRSLNLSNTVAVVVYEAWRQNGYAGGVASATIAAPAATISASSISPLRVWPMRAMACLRAESVR
jgi:tRNA C32,U32 (ribose-2'-O)-methylase TrmJ